MYPRQKSKVTLKPIIPIIYMDQSYTSAVALPNIVLDIFPALKCGISYR